MASASRDVIQIKMISAAGPKKSQVAMTCLEHDIPPYDRISFLIRILKNSLQSVKTFAYCLTMQIILMLNDSCLSGISVRRNPSEAVA